MTSFDENTLLVLKSHRRELQALLDHLDDFFTEISITGLASLSCEEGFKKISDVQNECQQLGLNSTAYLLKSFLEALKSPSRNVESRSRASLLLNRMLTWQIVFRKQFEYLTAGTQALGEKELAGMVETGVVEETYDLELIPFAVDLLKKTEMKMNIVVSCIDTSFKKFYQFKDEITTIDIKSSGPLKVKSRFFSGISWDYGSALNRVITVENVKLDTTKTKGSNILSSAGIKYLTVQRTITTGHTEFDRESFDPVLEVLNSTGLVTRIEKEKAHFTLNDFSFDRKNVTTGSRSALWRLWRVVNRHDTYMLVSKSKSKTKKISSLYVPSMKRLLYPAIEKFQTTSPWSEELDDWITPEESNFAGILSYLLLNPRYTKKYAGKLLEHCLAISSEINTVLPLYLLHKGMFLLNHQSTALTEELRGKAVGIAVENISRKPFDTNDDLIRFLLSGLMVSDLLTSKELSSLRNSNKKIAKSLIRGRKKKIKLDEDYLFLAGYLQEKLLKKVIKKRKTKKLQELTITLVDEIKNTSNDRAVLKKLPKLAVTVHLFRHSLSDLIHVSDQDELLESLYYIFKVENHADSLSTSKEEDLLNILCLHEIIYFIRKRKFPKLF